MNQTWWNQKNYKIVARKWKMYLSVCCDEICRIQIKSKPSESQSPIAAESKFLLYSFLVSRPHKKLIGNEIGIAIQGIPIKK